MKVCAEVKQNRHPLIMYPLLKNLTVSVKNYLNADSNTISTTEMYVSSIVTWKNIIFLQSY